MLLAMAALSFTSCNQKENKKVVVEPSAKEKLLQEAKTAIKDYINDKAINPKTFEIRDMKIVYLTDSACVIKFRFLAENGYGGHRNGKAQFVWLKYNGDTYQSWQDSSDDDIYEFGDRFLARNDAFSAICMLNLCLEMAEEDSVAHRMFYTKDGLALNNNYAKLYCIVMKKGERVVNKTQKDYSKPLTSW